MPMGGAPFWRPSVRVGGGEQSMMEEEGRRWLHDVVAILQPAARPGRQRQGVSRRQLAAEVPPGDGARERAAAKDPAGSWPLAGMPVAREKEQLRRMSQTFSAPRENDQPPRMAQTFSVPILRDPTYPTRRVRDPFDIDHRFQMRKHWLHDSVSRDASPQYASSQASTSFMNDPGSRDASPQYASSQTSTSFRKDYDSRGASPQHAFSQTSNSFMNQLEETRQRSKRLHTDPMDLEGPGKFHEIRKLGAFTQELYMDDLMCGFKRGDIASVQPGDNQEEYGDRALNDDFCFVVGKGWERGYIEVNFYSDEHVAAVKAEHLVKLTKGEMIARKFRLRKADCGLGGEAGRAGAASLPASWGSELRAVSLPASGTAPDRRGRVAGRHRTG